MRQNRAVPIQTVERACDLLEILKELDGATLTEVAEEADISKSSAYNHLHTLLDRGYVEREEDTYQVGLKWLGLAGYARDNHPLYQIGREATMNLAKETGEVAALTTENGGKSVYLYQIQGENAVKYGSHLGTRLPLHATAAGKAMLAHLSSAELHDIIDRHGLAQFTEQTITHRDVLEDELATVREQGYSIDDEERIVGMRGIGAPITDESNGGLLGALAIGGSTVNIQGTKFTEKFPTIVIRHARNIEISATYS